MMSEAPSSAQCGLSGEAVGHEGVDQPVCGCAACRDDQVGMLVLARRRQ